LNLAIQEFALQKAKKYSSHGLAQLKFVQKNEKGHAMLGALICLYRGYKEPKTSAAAPASPTMRRLLCFAPAPLANPLAV